MRVPAAREGARGLRLAPHLPRRRPRQLDFFLRYTTVASMVQAVCRGEEFSIDVFCDLDGRCLDAIPRTMIESKGGESIKGMTIRDWELIEVGRTSPRRCRSSAPRTSSASASPAGATRSPTSTRASAALSRCRSRRAAATRSSRSRSRPASGPEPRLGDFREGVVMTRFFSHLCLALARRDPGAVRRGAARAGRGGAGRDVIRLSVFGAEGRCVTGQGTAHGGPVPKGEQYGLWAVRYVVTGAAGFIGSHLAEACSRRRGTRSSALDCFTDYYDRRQGGERARARRAARRPRRGRARPRAASTGSSTSPASRACASFGDVFRLYLRRNVLASQRVFEAAAAAGVRVVFASSSSVYGEAERYPTPEDMPPRPISPYGITKLACEHLAPAYARSFGLDAVVLRYFTVYGPRQRPDMAFTRIVDALAEGRPFTLYGDGEQSAELHVRRRRRRRHDRRDGARPAGAVYNVGGGDGDDDERGDRARRADRGPGARPPRAAGGAGRPAPHEGRHDAHPARARLGAADALEEGLRAQWEWAAVESRAMTRRSTGRPISRPSRRSTSAATRAGSPRTGGCRCSGSCSACSPASRSRSAAARSTRRRRASASASRSRRTAARPSRAPDEPAHRRGDRALRGGARDSVRARRGCACGELRGSVSSDVGAVRPRRAADGRAARHDQGRAAQPAQGREGGERAREAKCRRARRQYVDRKIEAYNETARDGPGAARDTRVPRTARSLRRDERALVPRAGCDPRARSTTISAARPTARPAAGLQQLLALAQDVEQARVYERAVAVKTTARSSRNARVVGALLGLLLGCAAALLASRCRAPLPRRQPKLVVDGKRSRSSSPRTTRSP